jgi:hypothetical protein
MIRTAVLKIIVTNILAVNMNLLTAMIPMSVPLIPVYLVLDAVMSP